MRPLFYRQAASPRGNHRNKVEYFRSICDCWSSTHFQFVVPLVLVGTALLVLLLSIHYRSPALRSLPSDANAQILATVLGSGYLDTQLGIQSVVPATSVDELEPEQDVALRRFIWELSPQQAWTLREKLHILRQRLAAVEQQLAMGTWDHPLKVTNDTEHASEQQETQKWLDQMRDPFHPIPEVSIPYYLYEDEAFLAFERYCFFGSEGTVGRGSHMGEYWSHQQLKTHRWRVKNAADALVHVVPVYLGAAVEGYCGDKKLDIEDRKVFGQELIANATQRLQESPWFQRNGGNDHLFMGTHWLIMWWMRDPRQNLDVKVWKNLIWGRYMASFEESFCQVISPYSTLKHFTQDLYLPQTLAAESATIDEYLSQRPYSLYFVGRAWQESHAGGYETRRDLFMRLPGIMEPNVFVTVWAPDPIPECPKWSLEKDYPGLGGYSGCMLEYSAEFFMVKGFQSKFHLMIRGDDWTSARLFDIINFGAIPVVLSDGLLDKGLPTGCRVDWDQILIRIPEFEWRNSTDVDSVLKKYLPDWTTEDGRAEMAARLKAVQAAQKHILWTHRESRAAENFLLDSVRRCLPEAAIQRHRYMEPIRWWQPEKEIQAASRSYRLRKPLGSLAELTCSFPDRGKGYYRPAVYGMGKFQYGWGQDD